MSLYERHFSDPRRERAFLGSVGFTSALGTARAITHLIRAGKGPFGNMSAGGTHLHHSTFGIFGLLGIGYLWNYQLGPAPATAGAHGRPPPATGSPRR